MAPGIEGRGRAYLLVLSAVVLWSLATAVTRLLMDSVDLMLVLFYNLLFSAAGLWAAVALSGRAEAARSVGARDVAAFALMGVLGCYGYYLLLYASYGEAPVAEAMLTNNLWPVLTVLFTAMLLRERPSWRAVAGLATSFAGVAVIATHGDLAALSLHGLRGAALSAAAAASYALFSAIGKLRGGDKLTTIAWSYGIAFLLAALTLPLLRPAGYEVPSGRALLGVAYIGLFSNAAGSVLWLSALSSAETASVANLAFLNPVLALFFLWALAGDPVHPSAVAGLGLIVGGIAVTGTGEGGGSGARRGPGHGHP